MNWILVAFIFNLSPTGDLADPKMLYRGFLTEAECNAAGEHFRDLFALPQTTKSVSICIDKTAFSSTEWQLLEQPKATIPATQRSGVPEQTLQHTR